MPNKKLRIAIEKIEQGKIAIAENVVLHNRVTLLQQALYNRDSANLILEKRNKENKGIIDDYLMLTGNLRVEVALTKDLNNDYKNEIKRWRGATVKIAGISLTVVAGLVYLLVKK